MIKLYLNSTNAVMIDVVEPYITHKFNGIDTLNFDISPYAEHYKDMAEESTLFYEGAFYTVKLIDERQDITSVECDLCLDDLKANCFNYETTEKTLSYVLGQLILYTTGWTYTNASAITISRSIELSENVNILDVLSMCADIYGCQFQFDNVTKVIDVVKYEINEATGTYFTDELNLKDIAFKGDSTEFCTRLIGYGKKDETTGEYLTFTAVNGGKNYVENYSHSDKIITKAFVDERFTDGLSLRDEAISRLALLAIPTRSYECTVTDLAKINPDFVGMLDINLYDIVTLIDRRRDTRINHRVMEYVEYPEKPENNIVTLASVVQTITGTVSQVNQIITNIGALKVNGVTLNEFKRDIDSNSLAITNTYTKDQTDNLVSTEIQQSATEINLSVSEQMKLKSTIYTLPPDTYLKNDIWIPDKDYLIDTTTFEIGTNYLAMVDNATSTKYNLVSSDGFSLISSDNFSLISFTEINSLNWDKKDKYTTEKNIISSINLSPEEIAINANKINLNGVVTANENFKILLDGSIEATNGKFNGTVNAINGTIGDWNINNQGLYKYVGGNNQYASISPDNIHIGNNNGSSFLSSTGFGLDKRIGTSELYMNGIFSIGTNAFILNTLSGDGYTVPFYVNTDLWADDIYSNGVLVTSDRKLKKDIKQVNSYALDKLNSCNFYSYTINKPHKDKEGNITDYDNSYKTDIGLMTDECPSEIISDNGEYQSVDLYASISMSIKAIQELSKKLDRLTNKVENLEIENIELKKEIERQKQVNKILIKRSAK